MTALYCIKTIEIIRPILKFRRVQLNPGKVTCSPIVVVQPHPQGYRPQKTDSDERGPGRDGIMYKAFHRDAHGRNDKREEGQSVNASIVKMISRVHSQTTSKELISARLSSEDTSALCAVRPWNAIEEKSNALRIQEACHAYTDCDGAGLVTLIAYRGV